MAKRKLYSLGDKRMSMWGIIWGISLRTENQEEVLLNDFYQVEDEGLYGKRIDLDTGISLIIALQIEEHEDFLIVKSSIVNNGLDKIFLDRLRPLIFRAMSSRPNDLVFFRQGWQSWSATGSFAASQRDKNPLTGLARLSSIDTSNCSPGRKGRYTSDMYALLYDKRQDHAVLLGALSANKYFTSIKVDIYKPRLTLEQNFDGLTLHPDEEFKLEPLVIIWGQADTIHKKYADLVRNKVGKNYNKNVQLGWHTKDLQKRVRDEGNIMKNLGAIRHYSQELPLQTILIDDGYQKNNGEWLQTNDKFPAGLESLAEKIRRRGFAPGLWLAPFIGSLEAEVLQENPAWFIKNKDGQPCMAIGKPFWHSKAYALDTTHPGFQNYLQDIIDTLIKQWGYIFLKLDFLYAAALPGQRYDKNKTRAEAMRLGLELIREAAGDKAFLAGNGCPIGSAIGILDSMQTGPNPLSRWDTFLSYIPGRRRYLASARSAIRNALTRAYLHNTWWHNDLGNLPLEPTGSHLNDEEFRSLATAAALSRGLMFVAGNLTNIPAQRLRLFNEIESIAREMKKGVLTVKDLLRQKDPELVVVDTAENTYLAVFNMRDKSITRRIDLNKVVKDQIWPAHLVEQWTREAFYIKNDYLIIHNIAAHGVKFFRITKG